MKKLFLLIAIGFGLLISCSKDESNNKPADQLISPYDSDALSKVLIMLRVHKNSMVNRQLLLESQHQQLPIPIV